MAADHDKTYATRGATDGNQLWPWFFPPCPEERGKPMLGGEMRREERLLSGTIVCVDRVGAYDDMSKGIFRMPFPRNSGTDRVAHEPRPSKPDSTSTCCPARMISALERRERAAHLANSDIVFFFMFYRSDIPCLSLYDSYYVVAADGEGWTRRPPGVKSLP
jgi:hypothetical protein